MSAFANIRKQSKKPPTLAARARDARGMTLIDMAIALLIISLLTVPMIQIYNVQRQQSLTDTTRGNLDAIRKAMDDFYFNFGRYPCPADLTLGPGAPNYGKEAQPCDPAGSANVIVAATPTILRGGVPFATLQMPMSLTLDGWSRKVTYTVTRAQVTTPVPPAVLPAGVLQGNILDDTNTVSVSHTNSHYILVSHGEDGIGAYTQDGALVQACPAPGPTFTNEAENCNDDALFFVSDGNTQSKAPDASYYDDITSMIDNAPTRIWTTSNNANNIFAATNVAVGINNPNAVTPLDVVGNIQADGNADGDYLCDINGSNCFSTKAFAANNSQMQCSGSTTSTGMNAVVTDNSSSLKVKVTCSSYFPAATPNQTCPSGERVIGITAGGAIQCAP